jgi:p-hydroxybenzoate 3-monooxygenase
VLAHLLAANGIESVVLESREREYVERRIRAGVLEQGTVDLLHQLGLAERLQREGLVHRGIELRFDGQSHRIPLSDLTGGRAITVYGQQEVVKDLIRARLKSGGAVLFGAEAIGVDDVTSPRPVVRFRHEGRIESLEADFVAGCDGSHGVCRSAIPASVLKIFQKDYPVAWLGVLAEVAPSTEELIYAYHERGFALHSMRSPHLSRLYVQCPPDDSLDNWSDDRIWSELHQRFAMDGWSLAEGPLVDRSITPMRSVIVEPMQYARLYLAGDAAHIVPATGAKGLNLAVSDVRVLAEGLGDWYRRGRTERLEQYSSICLRRVWRVEHFSWWMTSMLHRFDDDGPFEHRLHLSQLRYVCGSTAAATSLAENYVGLVQVN